MNLAAHALDVQIDLLEFYTSLKGVSYLDGVTEQMLGNKSVGLSEESSLEGLQLFVRELVSTALDQGTTYAVSSSICEQLASGMRTLPDDMEITGEMVPSRSGFVLLEAPIEVRDSAGERMVVTAFSWARVKRQSMEGQTRRFRLDLGYDDPEYDGPDMNDTLVVTLFTDVLSAKDTLLQRFKLDDETLESNIAKYLGRHCEYTYSSFLLQDLYAPLGGGRVGAGVASLDLISLVYCFLNFIQQEWVSSESSRLPRSSTRRAARVRRSDPEVRVVKLRRESSRRRSHSEGDGSRTVNVQYWVDGFWRRPPNTPLDHPKTKFVNGHWRGPEDAPIAPGTKVFLVSR